MVLHYVQSTHTDMVRHIVVNILLSVLILCFHLAHHPHLLHEQCLMSINLTQALTLLLLTRITLAANLGLHLIIYVTHPANQIGFDL